MGLNNRGNKISRKSGNNVKKIGWEHEMRKSKVRQKDKINIVERIKKTEIP